MIIYDNDSLKLPKTVKIKRLQCAHWGEDILELRSIESIVTDLVVNTIFFMFMEVLNWWFMTIKTDKCDLSSPFMSCAIPFTVISIILAGIGLLNIVLCIATKLKRTRIRITGNQLMISSVILWQSAEKEFSRDDSSTQLIIKTIGSTNELWIKNNNQELKLDTFNTLNDAMELKNFYQGLLIH